MLSIFRYEEMGRAFPWVKRESKKRWIEEYKLKIQYLMDTLDDNENCWFKWWWRLQRREEQEEDNNNRNKVQIIHQPAVKNVKKQDTKK